MPPAEIHFPINARRKGGRSVNGLSARRHVCYHTEQNWAHLRIPTLSLSPLRVSKGPHRHALMHIVNF